MNSEEESYKRKRITTNEEKEMQTAFIEEEYPFSNLPIDIVFNIFTRLSLRAICKCRYVCKLWTHFVLCPRFAEMHFAKYKDHLACSLFNTWGGSSYKLIDPEDLASYQTSARVYDLDFKEFREAFKFANGFLHVEVVGAVNGLVCFSPNCFHYEPAPYYLVNPITKDYTFLPRSPKIHIQPLGSGFGYDLLKKEYKIVRILRNFSKSCEDSESEGSEFGSQGSEDEDNDQDDAMSENEEYETVNEVVYGNKVEIYTLGSGTWREMQLFTKEASLTITCMRHSNVLLHGCLHWAPQVNTGLGSYITIISFDVANEAFNQIETPFLNGKNRGRSFDLFVLNECLCVVYGSPIDGFKVWSLKEYRVDKSWVQEFTFQPNIFHVIWHGNHEVMELKNDEILLVDKSRSLVYYDWKRYISTPIMLYDRNGNVVLMHPHLHVFLKGSLFSPSAIDCH